MVKNFPVGPGSAQRPLFQLPKPPSARLLGLTLVTLAASLTACEGGSPESPAAAADAGEAPGTPAQAGAPTGGPMEGLPAAGKWRGSLMLPGGGLTFGIDFEEEDAGLRAILLNGEERRAAGIVEETESGVVIPLPPYQSRLVATLEGGGEALVGRWQRDKGEGWVDELPFAAIAGAEPLELGAVPGAAVAAMSGRWSVDFAKDDEDAVGLFSIDSLGRARGTFLTTLGDYRYLAGYSSGTELLLGCFDGAHAFLFTATMQENGGLKGEFWSRGSYHDTWTAVKDSEASLPDDFALTAWVGGVPLSELTFPDEDGEAHALDDPAFAADARLLVVFGTWCPNCNDLTEYLVQLDEQYEGLGIVGLAFEMGDDPKKHAQAVRDYRAHHGAQYPILIGGTADKAEASKAFPLIDQVRAYPTTVFMDREGNVSAVHTGFSGPATEDAHATLKTRFESEIESLLAAD
ncbi:MAG: TlpA disulfide reductase family protein [Planctomycetota bacterium]